MYERALTGIVIDAGHGGDDPGAIGNGIIEKDLTLLIAKYIYNRFKELNVPVKITRTTDETLDQEERINRILNAFGNGKNVIVISNHINAGGVDIFCVIIYNNFRQNMINRKSKCPKRA